MASLIPATLLDAVTSTGAGATKTGGDVAPAGSAHFGVCRTFSIMITYATAAPTAATVLLQGSHDGVSWVTLGTSTDVSTTVVKLTVVDEPFSHVRGNLSVYTAGSCTGVTATCIGVI